MSTPCGSPSPPLLLCHKYKSAPSFQVNGWTESHLSSLPPLLIKYEQMCARAGVSVIKNYPSVRLVAARSSAWFWGRVVGGGFLMLNKDAPPSQPTLWYVATLQGSPSSRRVLFVSPAVRKPGLHVNKSHDRRSVEEMWADHGCFFTGGSYLATSPLSCQVKSHLYTIAHFKWQTQSQCAEGQDRGQIIMKKKNKTR